MKAVMIMYDPEHRRSQEMVADIKAVSGQDVGEIWKGKIRYRPKRMYFRCGDEDILYFTLKYGMHTVYTGDNVELIHKQMGI
jgi:hypothetical protein